MQGCSSKASGKMFVFMIHLTKVTAAATFIPNYDSGAYILLMNRLGNTWDSQHVAAIQGQGS